MSTALNSFDQSPMGGFVQSPLLARGDYRSRGYAFAGYRRAGAQSTWLYTRSTESYDTDLDVWSSKAAYATSFDLRYSSPVCFRIVMDSYLASGALQTSTPVTSVAQYHSMADTWAFANRMPRPLRYCWSGSLHRTGYVFAGMYYDGTDYSVAKYTYKYEGDTWSRGAEILSPARRLAASFTLGDRIYAVGGQIEDFGGDSIKENTAYDTVTDSWHIRSGLPTQPRNGATGATLANRGWILGGLNLQDLEWLNDTLFYDAETDAWQMGPLLPIERTDQAGVGRHGPPAFVASNQLHYAGGAVPVTSGDVWNSVDALRVLRNDSWTRRADMLDTRAGHGAIAI